MHDDDDTLAPYDLSAWEAPAPGAGLADAVLARMRATDAVEAPPARAPADRRRWWIRGAIASAVVAAAAVAIGLWGIEHAPASGHGEVFAERAQPLALGPTTAMLDAGTQLRWRRDARRLSIVQPRGAATWKVDEHDTLVIDAGAVGASVEATGASLRMEVEMNRSDTRALALSGATAIAVSLVTVIVYEGHVRVSQGGQTVHVTPGASLALRPPEAPEPAEQLAVGGGPSERERALEARVAELEAQLGDKTVAPTDDGSTAGCDEVMCVLTNYEGACCAPFKAQRKPPAEAPACDAPALKQKGEDHLQTGMDAAALAAFEASMKCKPDSSLHRLAYMAACRSKNTRKARIYYGKIGPNDGLKAMCIRNGIDPTPCDATKLRAQGEEYLQVGQDAAALASLDASVRCKSDAAVIKLAFIAACRAKNQAKAKHYYPKLPEQEKSKLVQICIRNGIDADGD